MSRRIALLVAAVLIAVLGATGVFLYVRNLERATEADQELFEVLIATQSIEAGQTAAEAEAAGSLELVRIPGDAVGTGALSSIDSIRDEQALSQIYEGEQILEQKFGALGSSVAIGIPEGKLALSVQLSDPARVAGFVAPGSEVAVFFTGAPPAGLESPEGGGDRGNATATTLLLPRVEVIGTGQTTSVARTTTNDSGTQTTEQIPLAILTLALDQEEAQQVVQAQAQGTLYLGLLTETSETVAGDPVTTFEDLVTP